MLTSTFSFAAHSSTRVLVATFAPGTQWSQKPIESFPAACAPRTYGAAMSAVVASAAVFSALRRVNERIEIPPFRMLDMVVVLFGFVFRRWGNSTPSRIRGLGDDWQHSARPCDRVTRRVANALLIRLRAPNMLEMPGIARKSPYAFLSSLPRQGRGGTVRRVQDVIRDAIVRLDLPPGTAIDKAALCTRLGVSRFPVSEALGRLAAEGLVEILPQRGTRVARIDVADCRQAMFIRRALEIETVRAVAPRADAGLLAALDRNLREHQGALGADDANRFH